MEIALNEKLRNLREQKNLTQKELAFKVNRTQQAISQWERHITEPDYDDLAALADVFGVSVDWLLGNAPPKRQAEEADRYITMFRRIIEGKSDAQIMFLLHSMESLSKLDEIYRFA